MFWQLRFFFDSNTFGGIWRDNHGVSSIILVICVHSSYISPSIINHHCRSATLVSIHLLTHRPCNASRQAIARQCSRSLLPALSVVRHHHVRPSPSTLPPSSPLPRPLLRSFQRQLQRPLPPPLIPSGRRLQRRQTQWRILTQLTSTR